MPHVMVIRPALVNLATTYRWKLRLAHVSIGHVAMRTPPMTQTILTGSPSVFSSPWYWRLLQQTDAVRPERLCVCPDVVAVMANVVRHSEQCHDILCEAGTVHRWCSQKFHRMAEILRSGFHCRVSFHDDPAIILDDGQYPGPDFPGVQPFRFFAISPTASAAVWLTVITPTATCRRKNVNGFSWSTNSTTSFGQMMYQTGSGATATQTRDGNMVMDGAGDVPVTGWYQCNASDCSGTTGNGPEASNRAERPAWVQQQYCQCLELAQPVWF